MKTVVFLGAKNIGLRCLQYLLQHTASLQVGVVAAATQPNGLAANKAIGELCARHGIGLIDHLHQIPECDLILSIQYHQILKPQHIARAGQIAVNLHMAPLPEYRGCNQFSFAILDRASEFGTTLHRLEPGIDSGAILFEKRFSIPPQCWVKQLYQMTETASEQLFKQHLADLINGNYQPVPQETLLEQRGCSYHYRNEIEQIKKINLNWSAEKIERHLRATCFPPFEPPYALVGSKKVYFTLPENETETA